MCDLYQPYLDFAAKKIGGSPRMTKDYHEILSMKDVDAVVICTPDHWHALQTIHACQAGKDVYVEKPLSLCVAEGRAMVEAARKAQGGHAGRSDAAVVGVLPRRLRVRPQGRHRPGDSRPRFHIQNEWPKGIGNPPNEEPPKDFDWDAWLGPAPKVPYNKNRTFYRFRWFYDYSGGQLTNFGVHYLDLIHWALGQDAPLAVTAIGGKYAVQDNREVPDTLEVLWQYPGNTLATFSQFNCNAAPAGINSGEVELRGTKGTVYIQSNGWEVVPDVLTDHEFPARTPIDRGVERGWREGAKAVIEPRKVTGGKQDTADHARNFLDCVVSRQPCNADIEIGHRDTTAALIAEVALKTKTYLEWDAKAEKFTNHEAANERLRYNYRPPYQFPA